MFCVNVGGDVGSEFSRRLHQLGKCSQGGSDFRQVAITWLKYAHCFHDVLYCSVMQKVFNALVLRINLNLWSAQCSNAFVQYLTVSFVCENLVLSGLVPRVGSVALIE